MARLVTSGAETGAIATEGQGIATLAGTPTVDATTKRTGAFSFRMTAGAGSAATLSWTVVGALATTYYFRAYFTPTTNFPTATFQGILEVVCGGVAPGLQITTAGVVQLHDGTAQVGSDGPTLTLGSTYRLELAILIGTGTIDYIEGRVDGVSFASATNVAISDTAPTRVDVRYGGTGIAYFDDIALNDSTGASQTSWPGVGSIVLLKPAGTTNQLTASTWTDGAAAVTAAALAAASDNTPVVGNTIAASVATDQIEDPANNTAAIYEALTTTYTAAGMAATDSVTLLQGIAVFGQNSVTASTLGLTATTNVSGTATAEASTVGTTTVVAPFATTPAAWKSARTALLVNPSVTQGNGALIKVRKILPASTVAMAVGLMGVYVEFAPTPPAHGPQLVVICQAVQRAAVR